MKKEKDALRGRDSTPAREEKKKERERSDDDDDGAVAAVAIARFRASKPRARGEARTIVFKRTDEGLRGRLPREVADVAAAALRGGGLAHDVPGAAAAARLGSTAGVGGLRRRVVLAHGQVAVAEGVAWRKRAEEGGGFVGVRSGRIEKSLRNGVHLANGVVWEPVYRRRKRRDRVVRSFDRCIGVVPRELAARGSRSRSRARANPTPTRSRQFARKNKERRSAAGAHPRAARSRPAPPRRRSTPRCRTRASAPGGPWECPRA